MNKIVFGFVLITILLLTACTDSPGPLAPDKSRIKVKCGGFSGAEIDAVIPGGSFPYASDELECFFYGEAYLDVPVPPESYEIRADRKPFETVHFTGPGQKKTIWYYDISTSKSFSF